ESPAPRASARSELRWMVGPSAIGSENGTPSSMTSAPASTSACMTGTSASSEGSPAVTKGIKALRLADLSRANLASMRFIDFLPPLEGEGAKRRALRCSQFHPLARGDGVHVLVAAAGQVAQHDRVLRHFAGQLDGLGDGMAGLER